MPIISSVIVSVQPQANGTLLVHERHTYEDGSSYPHIWHAPGDSDNALLEMIAQQRGQNIGAELDRRRYAQQEALTFEIPLTPVEIMGRLTPEEWEAFQISTDTTIGYFRALFAKASTVYRNDPLTQAGFSALVATGILTQARADEILV